MLLQLTPRDIEIFKALNRYRWARANFLHRLVGGSKQNVHRRLGILCKQGLLVRPEQQRQSWNARYAPRVYALTEKSKEALGQHGIPPITYDRGSRQFWHQLMVADILISFETIAKINGLSFRLAPDIIADKPLKLPCYIEWREQKVSRGIEPDALFALGDTLFLLEADRNTENLLIHNLDLNSYLRKLLCYRDIIFNKTTEKVWGIPTPFILTVTTSRLHLENIKKLFLTIAEHFGQQSPRSYHLLYRAIPILGSFDRHPEPLLSLLDDPWERIGHPTLTLRKEEISNGYAEAARAS